jgi:predicted TPR repeat methyltransferase
MPSTAATIDVSEALRQANEALDRGDMPQALKLLAPFEKTETSAEYLACLIEAQCMNTAFTQGEATFARASKIAPGHPRILHAAGLNAFHARDYALAEERLRAAIAADPAYASAYNNLGMNFEFMNRKEEARDAYEQALKQNPALVQAYKNLGRLAETQGRLDEARSYFEQGRARTGAEHEFGPLLANLGRNFQPEFAAPERDPHAGEVLAVELGKAALRHLPEGKKLTVLDLICGDGGAGRQLWEHTGPIIGVDPRIHLLQKAQEAGIYYDLKNTTPANYLRTCKRGETDLITANCAFLDQGDLLPAFLNIYAVLAPGGLIAMAFPSRQDLLGYFIEGHGVFSHDPNYVQARADFEGMHLIERIDYSVESHAGIDRDYCLMVFGKPA